MATFEERVEGLSGLAISVSSGPTLNELTEFLKDGVTEVTERVVSLKPEESIYFQRESATQSSNGYDLGGAKIISIVRENTSDGSSDGSTAWRECRQISPSKQSRVVDSTSLEYATAYNPVYMIGDSGINVYPTPDGTNDGYKVYYVNNVPTDKTNEVTLTYAHSDIKYFPNDKYYLVVLYAAFQSLLNNLSNFSITQTVPSLTLPSPPLPPSIPSFTTPAITDVTVVATTISNVGIPPTYTAPTVSGDGTSLTSISALDDNNTIDVLADQIEFDQFWSTAAHLIEDEEDVELANAQLQKIRTYVEAYSTQMQSNLNDFQKEQSEYQGKTQEALQQAQINAAKAQSQAQIDASKVTAQAQLDASDATQTASLLLQKENQEYASKLQKFQSDLGKYTSEVQAKVQDHTSQINEISAEIQIDTTEYNWKSQRYAALKGQYDQAFGLMAPRESKD